MNAYEIADSNLTNQEIYNKGKELLEMAEKHQSHYKHRSNNSLNWEKLAGLYRQAHLIRLCREQGISC